ncbi:MAG: TIGR02996 domain-containing protein [Planctomycetes bacterium]|nr:TIGR02996 domain-containing protein [Planctomycetota bacterium]
MTDRNTILATVFENPTDDTARLVLADLLRESDVPEEQALGRFLWGGITAAAYRDDDLIDDRLFYTAQAEFAAVASAGFPAQWLASLGIGPSPLTKRDWSWDNTRDRVTVRIGDALGTFTRGMLAELSLTLGEWYAVAPKSLASWPLEQVAIRDVPGLVFTFEKNADDWLLAAQLKVPGRRVSLLGSVIPSGVSSSAMLVDGPADWRIEARLPSRALLVADSASTSASLVADLREVAGDRWPSPPRKRR